MAGLVDIILPAAFRKGITRIAQAEPVLMKHCPTERYLAKTLSYIFEKTLADISPLSWYAGTPLSLGTEEKGTLTIEAYGIGFEIPKIDVDRLAERIGAHKLQNEMENKTKAMLGYQDKEHISAAMIAGASSTVDASAAKWTTSGNIQPDVSEAIAEIEKLNLRPTHLVVDPDGHRYLLNSLTTTDILTGTGTIRTAMAGTVRNGRVLEYLGLKVEVSNNLTGTAADGDTALVFASGKFGALIQAYPLMTIGPKLFEFEGVGGIYRAALVAADALLVDQPDAIATITEIW